jgi:NADH-quinone oxidoreductase subunit J
METAIFLVCAVICLAGAAGVVISRNPVHSALSLVATLFGIAVLFLNLNAQLLAAVQVIVYTGAIVVLILFVLMLLGVDREEDVQSEPLVGQRQLAVLAALVIIGGVLAVLILGGSDVVTGTPRRAGDQASLAAAESNISQIGLELFTTWVFPLEITAGLLTIAVVGAVLLSRRARDVEPIPEPESVTDPGDERLTVPPARHGDGHDDDADDHGAGA